MNEGFNSEKINGGFSDEEYEKRKRKLEEDIEYDKSRQLKMGRRSIEKIGSALNDTITFLENLSLNDRLPLDIKAEADILTENLKKIKTRYHF